MLRTPNPLKTSNIPQKICPMRTNSHFIEVTDEETKIPFNTNNVGYKWQCETHRERNNTSVYEGETGRSARLRGRST